MTERYIHWLGTWLTIIIGHLSVVAVFAQGNICNVLDGGVTSCEGKGLTYVPRNLPPATKLLRLYGNSLERIEEADFPIVLPELEELDLSNNYIRQINTSTFCHKLPKLKILRLTKNKLSAIPDLRFCSSLVELHSANNEIVGINRLFLSGLSHLEKVDLSKNNLSTLNSSMFPTNTSIKQLLLNNNEISNMSSGAFVSMPTLERLRISRNKLSQIPQALFTGLHNLQYLDFSKNRLTEIGHRYFTELRNVKSINLERNKLTKLLDGSFYHCGSLESLNLESNLLSSVEAGPFFGLGSLKELFLAKNNISSIDENTWSQAYSITVLDLSQNNLQLIHSADFLRATNFITLKLTNNKIKQIEENAFNGLTNLDSLDLSDNELDDSIHSSSTTVFSDLAKLTSLNLKNNGLQTINSKLLEGLESLETLDLSNNPVSTVGSYAFSALPRLTSLSMRTDKLVCDCKISWLPPWLNQKELASTVHARCDFPENFVGQSVFDIDADLFTCEPGEIPVIPFITRELRPTNSLKGSNVTLTCIATADSQKPVVVEWRKDNQKLDESLFQTEKSTAGNRVALYTSYLRIYNVVEETEGNYQCGFKNEYGQDYSDSARLQVLVFPAFANKPSNVTVKTGQEAKLLCEATGFPRPFLSWSKDGGKNFPAARDRRFNVNPDNLNEFIIQDVQWRDRGVYYCNATNIAGSIISNATVNVMVPPMFTEPILCTNTRAGAYLLKCQADGNPKTPIVWYKDGRVIQASKKYIFSVTYNNLFIIDATAEDSGTYMCSARNLLGQVTQQCNINVKDSTVEVTAEPVLTEKKTNGLDQNTITGLIVIAVVCCVVGTSLIWVVIIYKTRRRQNKNGSNETEDTTVPLNSGMQTASCSTHKIGDTVSNSSGSSQTKTDSFFEYRGSRDSPGVFYKGRDKYPTMDSELAAAMEPLNPNQDSADSLVHDPHSQQYGHHTVGPSALHSAHMMSRADYYAAERAHPFSTFQPSRHHHRINNTNSYQRHAKPSHSISAEFIPYIDKRSPPPDLAQVLHQLRAPTQPPHAVVTPVHPHRKPIANSVKHLYEEPGYMNLPRSAVTSTIPKNRGGSSQEHSDYMNLEPKDTHIYQNTSVLSINPSTNYVTNDSVNDDPAEHESTNSNAASISKMDDNSSSRRIAVPNNPNNTSSHHTHDSNTKRGDSGNPSTSSSTNPSSNSSTSSASSKSPMGDNCPVSPDRRREGLADRSFVEKKYGLIFTDDFPGPSCHNETKSGDTSRGSQRSRVNL